MIEPCDFCGEDETLVAILAGSHHPREQVDAMVEHCPDSTQDVWVREHHLCRLCSSGVWSLQKFLEGRIEAHE